MELVTANVSGGIRHVTEGGRDFLVAPVTLLVEGVLNGSKGALFYPFSEIQKTAHAWHRMPLTLSHPFDPVTNDALSAGSEGVRERQWLGEVRNPKAISTNRKLIGEAWFDRERTARLAPGIINALQAGQKLEISTGLFTSNAPAHPGANWNGKPFAYTASAYKPDHLAVLLNELGACSVADGCGVNNRESQPVSRLERFIDWLTGNAEQPRHQATGQFLPKSGTSAKQTQSAAQSGHSQGQPQGKGDDGPKSDEDRLEDAAEAAGMSVEEFKRKAGITNASASAAAAKLIGRKNASGDDGRQTAKITRTADIDQEDEDDHSPASLSRWDDTTKNALLAYNRDWPQEKRDKLDSEDFAGPDQSFPITTQEDVNSASKLIGKADKPDAVKKKIMSIAKRKGLTIPDAWQTTDNQGPGMGNYLEQQRDQASRQATAATALTGHQKAMSRALQASGHASDGDSEQAAGMHGKAASQHEKAAAGCYQEGNESEGDSHMAAAAQHRKAAALHAATRNQNMRTTNAGTGKPAGQGFGGDEERKAAFAAMAESGSITHESGKAAQASRAVQRKGSEATSADHHRAAAMHDKAAEKQRTSETGTKERAADHAKAAFEHRQKAGELEKKEGKEARRAAHREAKRATLRGGTNNMDRSQMVAYLTHNCSCSQDRAAFNAMSDDTLRRLVGNAMDYDDDEDDDEEEDDRRHGRTRNAKADGSNADVTGSGSIQAGGEEDDDDADDPDIGTPKVKKTSMSTNQWLATAPPEVRSVVENAMAVERNEKTRLVERLTANVMDGGTRKRLTGNLMAKSIGELRDMALMLPAPAQTVYQQPTANFLGAGGGGDYTANYDRGEPDILPLPVMNYGRDEETA